MTLRPLIAWWQLKEFKDKGLAISVFPLYIPFTWLLQCHALPVPFMPSWPEVCPQRQSRAFKYPGGLVAFILSCPVGQDTVQTE